MRVALIVDGAPDSPDPAPALRPRSKRRVAADSDVRMTHAMQGNACIV